MENLGWFSMHRKYEYEPVFNDAELWKTWCWLYMKASHKQHDLIVGKQLVTLMPGELIWGKDAAARKLNIHKSKAYRHLKLLEKMGLIETKPNHNFTIVKVVVWDIEQNFITSNRTTNEPQMNHNRTTNEPQMNTNNNGNNGNTVEKGKKDSQSDLSLSGPVPYPQSVEEVRAYCEAEGIYTDPERFYSVNDAAGWKDKSGAPIRDWKKLCAGPVWNVKPTEPVQEQPKQPEPQRDGLAHELWSVYGDLSEDGEIEYNPIPPTSLEEMLKCYEDYSGYGPLVTEFYNYFNSKGWKVCGWKIRDWKLAFLIWLRFKNGGLEAKQIEQRMDSEKFSSIDSMFFCTEEERNKVKEKLDWRAIAAR